MKYRIIFHKLKRACLFAYLYAVREHRKTHLRGCIFLSYYSRCRADLSASTLFSYIDILEKRIHSISNETAMARRILLQGLSVEKLFKETITANIAGCHCQNCTMDSENPFIPFTYNFLVVFYQF